MTLQIGAKPCATRASRRALGWFRRICGSAARGSDRVYVVVCIFRQRVTFCAKGEGRGQIAEIRGQKGMHPLCQALWQRVLRARHPSKLHDGDVRVKDHVPRRSRADPLRYWRKSDHHCQGGLTRSRPYFGKLPRVGHRRNAAGCPRNSFIPPLGFGRAVNTLAKRMIDTALLSHRKIICAESISGGCGLHKGGRWRI